MYRLLFLAGALAAISACAPRYAFTPATPETFPAKPATCQLEVVTVPPQRSFVELGTFEVTNGRTVGQLSRLVDHVSPQACQVGADAIIPRANSDKYGDPRYFGATALRWTEAATPPTQPAPTEAPAASNSQAGAPPAPSSASVPLPPGDPISVPAGPPTK